MSEEYESLVHGQIDSEVPGKQTSFGTMAYNEGQDGTGNGEMPVNAIVHDTSLNTLDAADNGELIESPEETSILAQFHEEAIRQAGCGYSQIQVLFATILALTGATVEYAVVPFIVTSAAIEFCIEEHKKNWLGMITILGLALGAMFWGCLAGYVGKKRTLTSCLAVNAVFSVIAAVMPTYGIFMMARLCSAIGAGGILPASLGLLRELSPPHWRARVTALLLVGIGVGQVYAAGVAAALVPETGLQAFIENKAHLSAWHRYLLICTLPTLASLVSLIWTHESPKYLLENGREVDALVVYQEIHTSNGRWRCSGDYSPEQLDLPPTKHPQHTAQPLHAIFRPLCVMWRPPLGARTARLGLVLALAVFTQLLVAYHSPALVHAIIKDKYREQRVLESNKVYEDMVFNTTIENTDFTDVRFLNCVFRDTFLSQVVFNNCSFDNVTFSKVMTSHATFNRCAFVNTSLVDSDIVSSRDTFSCRWSGVVVAGVAPSCARRLDLWSRTRPWRTGAIAAACGAFVAAALASIPANGPIKHSLLVLLLVSLACTPALYLCATETAIFATEAVFSFLLLLVYYVVIVVVYDSYDTSVSCATLGLMLCAGFIAALCGVGQPGGAVLAGAALALASAASVGL